MNEPIGIHIRYIIFNVVVVTSCIRSLTGPQVLLLALQRNFHIYIYRRDDGKTNGIK